MIKINVLGEYDVFSLNINTDNPYQLSTFTISPANYIEIVLSALSNGLVPLDEAASSESLIGFFNDMGYVCVPDDVETYVASLEQFKPVTSNEADSTAIVY